jgi:hypothetical protein
MKRKVMVATMPWPLIIWWYCGREANLLPIPIYFTIISFNLLYPVYRSDIMGREGNKPLYLIVSKFNPTRFGSKKSLRLASHVPSPTYMVFELYVLLPGGERLSCGAIAVTSQGAFLRCLRAALLNYSFSPLSIGIQWRIRIDIVSIGM